MTDPHDDDRTREVAILSPGAMVGHYRVIEKIGAGGMGEVYLAEDTKLKRRVALKFLSPDLSVNQDARARFTREAQSVAALNHPNVVHIYEVGEHNGRPFFAMEYITGHSLHKFAHDDPQPIDKVIDLIIQVCEGLKEAHEKGIVHRDIKATNVVVDEKGRPRLVDFGLASVADDQNLTKTGSTIGTVAYMAPEQAMGKKVDYRSDLFSLGVVLYELLAGRTPFRRDSAAATLQAIVSDEAPPLSRYREDIPEQLQLVVSKLLKKNPDLRYQSAAGVLPDLKALQIERTTGPIATVQQPKSSKIALLVAAATVVVMAVVALVWRPWSGKAVVDTGEPMIAVLPFENLGNPEDEYFADGITDEITSRLSMIQGLGVISRNSASQYKDTKKSSAEIGRELGVNYLLEGTVRWAKSGDIAKVRITPQLIRVADDRQLWSSNYERALLEVFDVQADIALQIVKQLDLTLVDHTAEQLAEKPTNDPQAYDFYLKGLAKIRTESRLEKNAWHDGIADMDSAIARDSSFLLAYVWRSYAQTFVAFGGPDNYLELKRAAKSSAEKALELDPTNSYAHFAMGTYLNILETDYEGALRELRIAQTELKDNADILSSISLVLLREGKFAEAQEKMRRAVELDPLNAMFHSQLSDALTFTREFPEALREIDLAISIEPANMSYYYFKIEDLKAYTGDMKQIVKVYTEAIQKADSTEAFELRMRRAYDLRELSDSMALSTLNRPEIAKLKPRRRYEMSIFVYDAVNDTAMKRVYCDSMKTMLEQLLNDAPENGHLHSYLGLTLAGLGECAEAEAEGKKGMELLGPDACHW